MPTPMIFHPKEDSPIKGKSLLGLIHTSGVKNSS
jgi:hypothetical protein